MTWLTDLAEQARSVMPPAMWEHVEAGSWEGVSASEAAAAWHDVRFAPHVLRTGGAVDTSTQLLGSPVATPIAIAPTSLQRVAHPDGERAVARGAARAGALHVLSSNSGTRFAELEADGPWWLQVYVPPDRVSLEPVLLAARDAGAQALVLTVDTPVPGTKHRPVETDWDGIDLTWFRCNFDDPATTRWARDLGPDDIGWLAGVGLPVVVKGVLRGDDADRCVAAGAAAVWVSNHGGRQLDRAVTTRAALPEVVDAVGGRTPVYVDGGIRSGLDALAALALGADAVFVGRPALHALAVAGADGVARLLGELTDELAEALLLAGCHGLADAPGVAACP